MHRKRILPFLAFGLFLSLLSCSPDADSLEFHVRFTESVSVEPVSGRLFVLLDDNPKSNPMFSEKIIFAVDVEDWMPGDEVVLDDKAIGYPYRMDELPAGQYSVRALVDRNNLEWGLPDAPGNAYSSEAVLDIAKRPVLLTIDNLVTRKPFAETEMHKEVRITSKLLSDFYGRAIKMEAAVILPPSYNENPNRFYPVVYTFPGYGGLHDHIAIGEWMNTFEGVFSPRGVTGNPVQLWNRDTGEVNREVVAFWRRYDIRLIVEENWQTLGPKLKEKIFIYVADDDDARLDDSIRLFQKSMEELGGDAFIKILDSGGHGDGVWKQIIAEVHEQMDARLLKSYPELGKFAKKE